MTRPIIRDRDAALYLGLLAWGIGLCLLYDAYERRGVDRPKVMKLAGVFG